MHSYLNPYLSFKDNAREAMTFYQSIFGGDLSISTYGDYGIPMEPGKENNVMHANLSVNGRPLLMASDGSDGTFGKTITMSLTGTNGDELRKYWQHLTADGTINMPLEKQVWGDEFGMCTDKFGVQWMVNIGTEQ